MDIKGFVKSHSGEMVRQIARLVAIPSAGGPAQPGMPYGEGPTAALQEALAIASEMGFRTKNLDNYCGYAEIGKGEGLLGVLAHVDVVPAGDGWDTAPFELVVKDGRMYGRGATDNKGPVIMGLYAMKALLDLGVEPQKRIRVIIGANEETGFKCMAHYQEVEEIFDYGFSPDSDFPLIYGEKGAHRGTLAARLSSEGPVQLRSIEGGSAINVVASQCVAVLEGSDGALRHINEAFGQYAASHGYGCASQFLNDGALELTSQGLPAHGSRPQEGLSAIAWICDFLATQINGCHFLETYNELMGFDYTGGGFGIACGDEYGDLTLSNGLIYTGDDGKARFTYDIRSPITIPFNPLLEKIMDKCAALDVDMAVNTDAYFRESLFVDPDSEFIAALKAAYAEVTGDSETKIKTTGGGTYARAFKNCVAYGPEMPGCEDGHNIHMANEYLPIDVMETATEVYVNALIKLLEL